jgi:cell division protein YceG involved in septum cleavage
MFFVANGQGGHTFSRTLEEHNEAVRQLLIRGKKDPADQNTGEKQQ